MTKDELKKKLSGLSEEEKGFLKEFLEVPKEDSDKDLVDEILNLKKRVDALEKPVIPESKKGFFDGFFS